MASSLASAPAIPVASSNSPNAKRAALTGRPSDTQLKVFAGLHHAAHTAHAAHIGHRRGAAGVFFRRFGDHGFGGD